PSWPASSLTALSPLRAARTTWASNAAGCCFRFPAIVPLFLGHPSGLAGGPVLGGPLYGHAIRPASQHTYLSSRLILRTRATHPACPALSRRLMTTVTVRTLWPAIPHGNTGTVHTASKDKQSWASCRNLSARRPTACPAKGQRQASLP